MSQPAAPYAISPPLHLVAIRTATGAVTFFASRRPTDDVVHLGRHLVCEHRLVVETPRAELIVAQLCHEFTDRISVDGHPWFQNVDWETVLDTVRQFDLDTGLRIERAGIRVGQQVQVMMGLADSESKLRGTVTQIVDRRYAVDIPGVHRGIYTRNLLKPVVRVPALSEAA